MTFMYLHFVITSYITHSVSRHFGYKTYWIKDSGIWKEFGDKSFEIFRNPTVFGPVGFI